MASLQSIRSRSRSRDDDNWSPPISPVMRRARLRKEKPKYRPKDEIEKVLCRELSKTARKENDAMVYLDGPRIYTCGECRTHLTSHDEIISKSFHGRHGEIHYVLNLNVHSFPKSFLFFCLDIKAERIYLTCA